MPAPPDPVPSPYYRVSVKALVADADGRLLVVQNGDGSWEVPGGGWEHGETLEECLRREIREELGVGVRTIDRATIHPCVMFGSRGQPWLKLMLAAELDSLSFQFGDGMQATRFVSPQQFQALTMHPADCFSSEDAARFWPARGRDAGAGAGDSAACRPIQPRSASR